MNFAAVAYSTPVLAITILAAMAYRAFWRRSRGEEAVPSGFGALAGPVLMGAAFAVGARWELVLAVATVSVATAAYWLDDVIELSARARLLIAFVTGAAVAGLYLLPTGHFMPISIGLILALGLLCVILTNIVNFMDGADLNLATYILLTAALCVAFTPVGSAWAILALALGAFTLGFAFFNCRPRTLYLGDAGSFLFAAFLTLMAVAFWRNPADVAPEAAIPSALPAFDAFYVFVIRLRERHDLLSRNYMHLYQRLNRRYVGFGYLVPQWLNVLLCLILAGALEWIGLGRILSVVVAMAGVTVPLYFVSRKLFVSGEAEGPLQEHRG